MDLLLDTCAFLWLTRDPDQLSSPATDLINDPSNNLLLSEVSVMEMVMKNSAGKLPFSDKPKKWIPSRLAFHHVTSLPISDDIIYLSDELDRTHRDPFDRLIAAHAIIGSMAIVSPDIQLSVLGASRLW